MGLFDLFRLQKDKQQTVTGDHFLDRFLNMSEEETKAVQKKLDRMVAQSRKDVEELDKRLAIVDNLRNSGRQAESDGDIDKAIPLYEKSITEGQRLDGCSIYCYGYSINRLAILYRKRKDYDSEMRVLQIAKKEYEKEKDERLLPRTLERIVKVESLLHKRQRNG